MATATRRNQIYSSRVVEHAPGREVGVTARLGGAVAVVLLFYAAAEIAVIWLLVESWRIGQVG
jgi:hypothetical protein